MPMPMSLTDSMFLSAESPEQPMNVGALVMLSRPEGGDSGAIPEMLAAALSRDHAAPLWRRRPHRGLTSLGQWYWRTEDDVDLSYHVQTHALPETAGIARLWELAAELHSAPLDRSRPLWQFHLIEGLPDDRYAIYIKIHHALADGMSVMRMLRQTVSADAERRGMPALWETTEPAAADGVEEHAVGSAHRFDPLGAAETMIGEVQDLAGTVPALVDTTWRAIRRRGGPLTLAAPPTPLNVTIGSARSFAGCSFPLDRLRLVAKHTDATINDIVLTMCAGALRRYLLGRDALPTAPLTAMVPVSLRGTEPAPDNAPGNMIGTLICSLGTELADPSERLAAVQASMKEGKTALAGPSPRQVLTMSALGAAPLALRMKLGTALGPLRPPNVLISNVAGPAGPLYWNGARLEAVYPMSVPVDGQSLNITCVSINDQISFGLTGCRRAVPAIGILAEFLGRELDLLDTFHRIAKRPARERRRNASATATKR